MKKTLEEIRSLTASLLDSSESEEYVAGITEESLSEMAKAKDRDPDSQNSANLISRYTGHDMRYDGKNYLFRAGPEAESTPCGLEWWNLPMDSWNHQFLSNRCGNHNNLAVLLFTRR